MHSALPPLNALRAFEAAARHSSLTKAAQELGVTPGALSHQIRGLEEFLGVELFHRLLFSGQRHRLRRGGETPTFRPLPRSHRAERPVRLPPRRALLRP